MYIPAVTLLVVVTVLVAGCAGQASSPAGAGANQTGQQTTDKGYSQTGVIPGGNGTAPAGSFGSGTTHRGNWDNGTLPFGNGTAHRGGFGNGTMPVPPDGAGNGTRPSPPSGWGNRTDRYPQATPNQ